MFRFKLLDMKHPLSQFTYCPKCGAHSFVENNEKSKKCTACGFVYYFNSSAAVACFLFNNDGQMLLVRRAKNPAKGTLDLPGGFIDMHETAEEAVARELEEETGIGYLDSCQYLFSLPNIYEYSGFEVHTLDLFFKATVDNFEEVVAADDAAEILIVDPATLDPEAFGLLSIKKAVELYKQML